MGPAHGAQNDRATLQENSLAGGSGNRPTLHESDIVRLGEAFRRELDPIKRRQLYLGLLKGITPENAREIRAQIVNLDSDDPAFQDFHYAWGKVSGAEAVIYGKDTPKPDMLAAMAGWASENPRAATDWYASLDPRSNNYVNQQYLMRGVVHGLVTNDVNLATEFVYTLSSAGDRAAGSMMEIVASGVLERDGLNNAIHWSEQLQEGPLRAAALDRVAHDYANQDPVGAASWAEQFVGNPHDARVLAEVGHEWAGQDAAAAAQWAGSLDPSLGRNQALSAAYGQWGAREPLVAAQNLIEMPPSSDRNFAINGFISGLAPHDGQTAVNWAAEISEPGLRQSAQIRAGRQFFRQEQEAARTWLTNSGLPQETWAQVTGGRSYREE